jgi:hypothetical protein
MNISATDTIDLRGVTFADGIAFTFDRTTLLYPGQRLVIEEQQFLNGTALSNGGESVLLNDANGTAIRAFTYDENAPWPSGTDGFGFSSVLVSPTSNPDPSNPNNWKRGTRLGGTPGDGDKENVFQGDPKADDDNDGLNALLEFAFGNSDDDPTDGSPLSLEMDDGSGMIASFPVDPTVTGLSVRLETSTDLSEWSTSEGVTLIGIEVIGARQLGKWFLPAISDAPYFVRLHIMAQ